MEFINNEHKKFYEEKLKEYGKYNTTDVYFKSLIYTLGICETTRQHYKEVFNIKERQVNLDALQTAWQTDTSAKVIRIAFNLWNHSLMYDSEEDLQNERLSSFYAPSEIFCCSYAPYFWEAIKIRYPEYTKYEYEYKTQQFSTCMISENKEEYEDYEETM